MSAVAEIPENAPAPVPQAGLPALRQRLVALDRGQRMRLAAAVVLLVVAVVAAVLRKR